MRILVRVPEAYLLLFPLDTVRPGLLVLDADGRRAASLALAGKTMDPALLAQLLRDARTEEPVELFRLEVTKGSVPALRAAIEELEGVEGTALRQQVLRVAVTKGAVPPARLDQLARKHEIELRWQSPVAVRRPAQKRPGLWYGSGERVHVAPLLLHPAALPPDLEARRYRLPGIPKGGAGARVAAAPLGVPGVVSVLPDIFAEQQTVIGRKGHIRWKEVEAAFRQAGCAAQATR
ncbi:MAG: hypothetical protein ACYTEZ_14615 [Planctomycetota bacterium]